MNYLVDQSGSVWKRDPFSYKIHGFTDKNIVSQIRLLLCTSPWLTYWDNTTLHGWEDHDFRIGYKKIIFYKNNQFLPTLICFLAFLFPLCLRAEQYFCSFCISSVKLPHHTVTQALPTPQAVTEGSNGARGTVSQGQSETYSQPQQRASCSGELLNRLFIAACNLTHSCRMQLNPSPPAWYNLTGEHIKQGMWRQWTPTYLPALWVEKGEEPACKIAMGKLKRTGRRISSL